MAKRLSEGENGGPDAKLMKASPLDPVFYKQTAEDLAKALLGKLLVRVLDDGSRVSGYIVDTEAYPGNEDLASHSAGGKRTGHNAALYEDPGSVYIHNTFGGNVTMYITCKGEGASVMLRALEPNEGTARMKELRGKKREDGGEGLSDTELCSGPAKLTQALAVTRGNANKQNLAACDHLFVEDGRGVGEEDVLSGHRIGAESHGKWAEMQWRFHIKGNMYVSVVENAQKPSHKPAKASSNHGPAKPLVPVEVDLDQITAPHRLSTAFFCQPAEQLAAALLGKVLVRVAPDGTQLKCMVVETEAFPGGDDPASHSHGGARTGHNAALYLEPGTVYIHNTFGGNTSMYICSDGEGAAVLLRALEPQEGLDIMEENRSKKIKSGADKKIAETDLCSGPAKLTQSLEIKRDKVNKQDLRVCEFLWLEEGAGPVDDADIIACKRVGIKSAGDWASKPWRFYVRGNPHVSVVDKQAEKQAK